MAVIESQMTGNFSPIMLSSSGLQPAVPVFQLIIHSIPAHSEGQAVLQIVHTHTALDEPDSASFQPTLKDRKSPELLLVIKMPILAVQILGGSGLKGSGKEILL